MKRRNIRSFAMALVMCISMCMPGLTAYAVDPGDTPPVEPVCTCEDKCTEGSIDPDCSVCSADGADLDDCIGPHLEEEPATPPTNDLAGTPVLLSDPMHYVDETGSTQTCTNYTEVTSYDSQWSTGWYVVTKSSLRIFDSIEVEGDVNLILADKASLEISNGISVTAGNSLTIYGQTQQTGKLEAQSRNEGAAAIGGGGTITINGGKITARASSSSDYEAGAGIGGNGGGSAGTVTINGGTVTASGGYALNRRATGAGIGGGFLSTGGTVTITGGTVTAYSGPQYNLRDARMYAAAIGTGGGEPLKESKINSITICGTAIVKAIGQDGGCGIGAGTNGCVGTITITGGNVTATGSTSPYGGYAGAGIGLCSTGTCDLISISGGTVMAIGAEQSAGIGEGSASNGSTVNIVRITGGTVTAKALKNGPGIDAVNVDLRKEADLHIYSSSGLALPIHGAISGCDYMLNLNFSNGVRYPPEEIGDTDFVVVDKTGTIVHRFSLVKENDLVYNATAFFVPEEGEYYIFPLDSEGQISKLLTDDVNSSSGFAKNCFRVTREQPIATGQTLYPKAQTISFQFRNAPEEASTLKLPSSRPITLKDFANPEITSDWTYDPVTNDEGTWRFKGWTPVSIFDESGNVQSVTVYGDWAKEVTLSYDGDGGTPTPTKQTVAAGTQVSIPDEVPQKETYIFGGWKDENGKVYAPGDSIKLDNNTTLTAQWTPTITIKPANMISYIGGDSYDGVVNEDGDIVSSNGLPEPGFVLSFPEELSNIDVQNLYLQYKESNDTTLTWKFVKYGEGNHNVYRIEPVDETSQRDVRIEVIKADGEQFTGDSFDTKDYLNQSLTIEIYGEGIEAGKVSFAYKGKEYGITVQPATLTVRGTTSDVEYAKVLSDAERIGKGKPGLVANKETTYTINDSEVHVDDVSGISLLFDEIINDKGTDRTDLLKARTDRVLGTNGNNRYYDFKYLDLVDQNNGNTWVKANKDITVYWPLPEGTNANTQFKLLHFADAHRSLDNEHIHSAIQTGTVETMKIKQVTDTHVIFDVAPGRFSPFVLTWSEPDQPVTPPSTRYTITASAGEGGSISPSGTVSVADGADKTFTFTPDEGNRVADVIVDGESLGALGSYTFKDVASDHTIQVVFKPGNAPADPDDTGVSDWLNTKDHDVYLHGYQDGSNTFKPNGNMTRGEVACMFYNLLLDKSMGDASVTFEDVPEGAFYAEPIRVLASRGILFGTSPTTFAPDRPITRAEFTAIAMRFSKGDLSGENIFVDVAEGAWYYDVIVGSIKYGWIYGYQDGSHRFGPDDTITRAEATCIANRMLGRLPDGAYIAEHKDELKLFSDVSEEHFAWRDIIEATNAHDYVKDGGYEDWTSLKDGADA